MAQTYTGTNEGSGLLKVTEQDGTPFVGNVNEIKVSNGTLTDDGGGTVSVTTGGGGGGAGTVTSVSTSLSGLSVANATTTPAISGTLGVASGGTGATTLTDGGILLGSGAGAITPLAQATNGQLVIGSTGADPVLATLASAGGTVTITNSAGGINLEAATGSMTSWTLRGNSGVNQTITDAEQVTFSGSGGLTTVAGAVDLLTVQTTGVLEDLNTLGAPTADGEFIVATGAGAFAYETGATVRTSLGLGTIATQDANSVFLTGGTIAGITDLAIADGGTGQSTAQAAIDALTAVAAATNEFVLTKDTGTGNAIWKVASGGGGVITGTANGANDRITTYSGTTTLNGEANLTFNGTILTITGNMAHGVDATSTLGFYGTTPATQQTIDDIAAAPPVDPGQGGQVATVDALLNWAASVQNLITTIGIGQA